jgi:hypothetical protein
VICQAGGRVHCTPCCGQAFDTGVIRPLSSAKLACRTYQIFRVFCL